MLQNENTQSIQETKKDKVKEVLTWTDDFRKYSPSWVDKKYADTLATDLMVILTENKTLSNCIPLQVKAAVKRIASLGLNIGRPREEAHIVVIKGKPDVWIGYRGYIKLIERNPKVSYVKPMIVYKDDEFEYAEGMQPYIKHINQRTPLEKKIDENITHAYAIVFWKDGSMPLFSVLDRAELDKRKEAAVNKAFNKKECKWVTNFSAMCMKSAIIRVGKYMTLDDVYGSFIETDGDYDTNSRKPEEKVLEGTYAEQNSDEFLIDKLEGELQHD